jgi:threonine/homoserine/homoserine lactone efflux protein
LGYIILNGIFSGIILSFLIGPVFFVLLETSIKKGIKNAIFIDIGVIISDILYLLLAYFFAQKVNEVLSDNVYVKYIAALVFITMGVVSIMTRDKPKKTENIDIDEVLNIDEPIKNRFRKRTAIALILKGIGLNAINPGVLIYWIAACTAATEKLHISENLMIYYFGATLLTMFGIDLLKIYFARKLKTKMTPKMIANISVIIGVFFIVFGIMFAFRDIT